MAGDSAAVSAMHRPRLHHPLPPLRLPPTWGRGFFSATVLAVPCPHWMQCPWGLWCLCPVLGCSQPATPCPPRSLSVASCPEPPPGEVPSVWASPGAPILGSLGSPRVPRPLGPFRQPPCSQSQPGSSPPSEGAASRPAWAGRRPARGRFFGSGLNACCWQRGREGAERRAGAAERGLGSTGTTILLAVGSGSPGSWLRQAPGGREAPSPRRRRSCWNGCAGWTGAASEPAGATSTGSCAA